MFLVWVLFVLKHAKSSVLPNGNFFFGGGNFAFSKWEFPVSLYCIGRHLSIEFQFRHT